VTAYDTAIYFVTDIEADGPNPSKNSMLSFATVACAADRGIIDSFEAVLKPRVDRISDAGVMDWWKTQPEAYKRATENPRDASTVMNEFADWIERHDGFRIFASCPLGLDSGWIDEYLKTYVSTRIFNGPFKWRKLFHEFGVDIPSFLGGLFGWPAASWSKNRDAIPAEWRGNVKHTHRAVDDATGYAHLLLNALRMSAERAPHPQDFTRN
jgi:3' exoribonuclease, RNase T-like